MIRAEELEPRKTHESAEAEEPQQADEQWNDQAIAESTKDEAKG